MSQSTPTPAGLRECPFCGHPDPVVRYYNLTPGQAEESPFWTVECGDHFGKLNHSASVNVWSTEAEAIAAWNCRAEAPRCAGNEDAVRVALKAWAEDAREYALPPLDRALLNAYEAALAPVPQPPAPACEYRCIDGLLPDVDGGAAVQECNLSPCPIHGHGKREGA